MSRLPALTGESIVKALSRAGFEQIRRESSHVYLRHVDGRATVVPVHKGETVGRGLLSKIVRDAKLSRDDFLRLL